MSSENYHRMSLMIKTCFHSQAVASAAVKISPENLVMYGATRVQAEVFAVIHRHWSQYKALPTADVVQAEFRGLYDNLCRSLGQQAPPHLEELRHFGSFVLQPMDAAIQVRPFMDQISQIYRNTVGNQVVMQAANEAVMSGDYQSLIKQTSMVNAASGSVREPVNIMSKRNARPSLVVPSGLAFLDSMLGGGFRAGNAYGILAPTGGGKTTLAAQVSASMGSQGRAVALICTEQSADEPEFIDRWWALVTRKPTELFDKYNDEALFPPELVSDRDRQLAQAVSQNVQFYDFSKQPGNMAEVRSIAAGMSGRKPELILLDWAGSFAKQLIQLRDPLADTETNALKHIADECAMISREYSVPVVIFHQLRPDCDNPMAEYSHTDANMCKQFFFNLSYGIVIHPRDDNNVLVIRTTKGRWLGRSDQMVVLRGEISRFEEVNGYRRGKGRWVRDSDLQKMPTERKAQQPDVRTWMAG